MSFRGVTAFVRPTRHRRAPRSILGIVAAFAVVLGLFVLGMFAAPTAYAQDGDLSFELPLFGHTTFAATNTTIFRYRGENYDANVYDDDFASLSPELVNTN